MGLMFWKKKERFEEFVAYVSALQSQPRLIVDVIQRANELGLKGKRIRVIEQRNPHFSQDVMTSSIWFIGVKE